MRLALPLTLVAATALSACAGMGGPPPKRPAIAVADEVTSVAASDLVGSWTCRELNPYPEMPKMRTTMTFAADGTGASKAEAEPGQPNAPLGGMAANSTFKWRAEGSSIVVSDVKLGLGDAPSDAFTSVIQSVAGMIDPKAGNLKAPHANDVLQLGSGRFVMRGGGVEDPPVTECTR